MLRVAPYREQLPDWPLEGRNILAQYDDKSIVMYQAYPPSIGSFAAKHQFFGGSFSVSRMSWIKPNFLWMMFRSGWGTKPNQETVLAITIFRAAFDEILRMAVHSTFTAEAYDSHEEWRQALLRSPVRLQWDPDHNPYGEKERRRAIQLGLGGDVLRKYAREWIVKIEDISPMVREQRAHVLARRLDELTIPTETIYPISDNDVSSRLLLSESRK
jgi:hypothetical protein